MFFKQSLNIKNVKLFNVNTILLQFFTKWKTKTYMKKMIDILIFYYISKYDVSIIKYIFTFYISDTAENALAFR